MKAKKKAPMSETTTREIQAAIEALQRALNATCNKVCTPYDKSQQP